MTRSGKRTNFLETLLEAQRLAFAPFIFKALSAALESGLLAAVERSEGGADLETMARETNLSPYAAQLLLDILSTVSIVERTETGWRTTEKGDLFLFDDLTRANFDFTDRVNFAGLEHTLEALREGRPAGLQVFNADWETIYPHLPELPEDALRAWFRFDHFHSDRAYEAALDKIEAWCPGAKSLCDIGGNTGRFTRRWLERFPDARAVFVDLPVEARALLSRSEIRPYAERIDVVEIDWLTDRELEGTASCDLYWMSQFLDCFEEERVRSILERTRRAMKPGAKLLVLEPLVGGQRHRAAELSLAASSLYFTVMANGRSRFFEGPELRALFEDSGFRIEREAEGLGISHTLFLLSKA